MWTWIKRGAAAVGIGVIVLIAVLAVNTLRYTPKTQAQITAFELGADIDTAARHLGRSVQFKTLADNRHQDQFDGLLRYLAASYPLSHEKMTPIALDQNTLLFKWQGQDSALQPVLLSAHSDVVPIAPGSQSRWTHPAYDGVVADGFIWGRGTLDNKGALIALLTTAEHLIASGFTPQRTVYFAFGGDEEVGGFGAQSVAAHLQAQGIQLAWSLDEGSFVLDKIIGGIDRPVASINLSEKGYLTLTLTATAQGGHSSMPPRVTAVGRIARAISRLEEAPLPGGLDGVSAAFFDALGRNFTLEKRVLFANRWLFDPLLETVLSAEATTNAMLRTTTAPTMLQGSNKENVLATQASATVNFRLHPRDTVAEVIDYVTRVVDDETITITANSGARSEASPTASATADGYQSIESAVLATFGSVATVPGLTIAATDARHYAKASDNAYRINPFLIDGSDLPRIHGTDERLSVENLRRGINFYGALISGL